MFISARRSPTKRSVLITKRDENLNCFTIEKQIVHPTTTEDNLNRMTSSNRISSEPEKKRFKPRLIPPACECSTPSKSIALLRETLDIKPLFSAINNNSGKLDFVLPLFNTQTGVDGLQMKLSLQYQGVNQHASIMGTGWSLLEDYIAVDYQGNVDPMAHHYYWITNHGTVRLIRQNERRFKSATSYHLYCLKSLDENALPDIEDNAVVLVGPKQINEYVAYCVQDGRWMRNNENKNLKKVSIKNPNVKDFCSIESNGFVEITEKNQKNIVNVIKLATSDENYFDLNFIYHGERQCWELLTSDGEQRFYGNSRSETNEFDAVAWTIGWDNWLGIGNDQTKQKQYPIRWHLKEIRGNHNEKIIYHYENLQCQIGNRTFTKSLDLKSISDSYGANVELIYEDKTSVECEKSFFNDADGNFHLSSTSNRYLKTIQIVTCIHVQTIELQYELENKCRRLVALSQPEGSCRNAVLKFSYKDFGQSTQIDEICLPNGEKLNFVYQSNKLEHLGESFDFCTGEHCVHDQSQVTAGSDFVVLSEINAKMLNLNIFQKNQIPIRKFGEIDQVSMYRTFTRHNYFGFIVKQENNRFVLLLFHRHSSNDWSLESKKYDLSSFRVQCIDNILIIVNRNQQILEISWNNEHNQWQEKILPRPSNVSRNSELFVATTQSSIIVYDDRHLWIHWKDFNRHWQTKTLKEIPNLFSTSKETLKKFEMTETSFNSLHDYLKQIVLQSSNNVICLASWREENGTLESTANIFLIDQNQKITLEKVHRLSKESCEEIYSSYEEQEFIAGDPIKYRLKYQKFNGRFRVVFEPQEITKEFEEQKTKYRRHYELKNQDITVTIQGIKNTVLYNKDTGKWFSEKIDNLKSDENSLSKHFGEIILIDFNKYFPQMNLNQIVFGDKKLMFSGNQWEEISREKTKSTILLGKDFVLSKENSDDSVKLFQQNDKSQPTGRVLFDFETKSMEDLSNGYPTYIAYKKKKNEQIFVLPFDGKQKLTDVYHLTNGNLTPWSNSQFLVVSPSNSQDKLMIYSNLTRRTPHEDPVIIQSSLTMGSQESFKYYVINLKKVRNYVNSFVLLKNLLY